MRPIANLFAALCAISAPTEVAIAQTGDCRLIAGSAARLACYDKAALPAAAGANAAVARPSATARPPASAVESSRYVDPIGEEEALVNAKLRGICRGC